MKNTYTVTVYKQLPAREIMVKHLLGFQLRTGFPICKALELYKRPMTWEYTNKRDAQRQARIFRNDGTGRTVTLTTTAR